MGLDSPGKRVFSNLLYYPCPGSPFKSCTYTLTLGLFQQHLSWYDCRELVMRLGRTFSFRPLVQSTCQYLQPMLFPGTFNICETYGEVNVCDCSLFHLLGQEDAGVKECHQIREAKYGPDRPCSSWPGNQKCRISARPIDAAISTSIIYQEDANWPDGTIRVADWSLSWRTFPVPLTPSC